MIAKRNLQQSKLVSLHMSVSVADTKQLDIFVKHSTKIIMSYSFRLVSLSFETGQIPYRDSVSVSSFDRSDSCQDTQKRKEFSLFGVNFRLANSKNTIGENKMF